MNSLSSLLLVACVAFIAVRSSSAQQTVNCAQWLSAPANSAFPLQQFMTCFNQTTTLNTTRATEFVNTVRTAAALHSLGPYIPATLARVNALSFNANQNYELLALEAKRALGSANDLHLAQTGTPYLDSYFVIRMFQFSLRSTANGQGVELYVKAIQSQTVIDEYRAKSTLQGGTYSIPSYPTFAAALNKTVATVSGMNAMEWIRRETQVAGFLTSSMRLNIGVIIQFMFPLTATQDLYSEGEVLVFADGTSMSYPRIVLKQTERTTPRCDLPTSRRQEASTRRRQGGALHTPAGLHVLSEESLQLELQDDSIPLYHHLGGGAEAVARAVLPTASSSSSVEAAANTESIDQSPRNGLLFARNYAGLGKFEIQARASLNVAVMTINTFLPPSATGGSSFGLNDLSGIHDNITALFRQVRALEVQDLVLDLSGNTGGFVALQNFYLRELDDAYNLYWNVNATTQTPTLLNPTDQNAMWSRSYLRQSLQSESMGAFYRNLLNKTSVYTTASNEPVSPSNPVWFDPVGRTGDGWTPPYIRPTLFTVPSATGLFSRIKIVSDGICGSSCCLFMERVRRFGIVGATVEFVGFGGDTTDAAFQMGDACGGSVQKFCVATIEAGLPRHPFLTGSTSSDNIDVSFVDAAYFKQRTDTVAAQYDMQANAHRVIRDWDALGSADVAHERRMNTLYGPMTTASSSSAASSALATSMVALCSLIVSVVTLL